MADLSFAFNGNDSEAMRKRRAMAEAMMGQGAPPNKGETPQSVQRKREMAEAMMGRALRPAKDIGEGLAAVGQALIVRKMMGDVDKGEAAGRERAQSTLKGLFGGAPSDAGSPAPTAADYADTRVKTAAGDNAATIKQGLVDRGLSPQVADAFVMNFQDESGLNPGINEKNPTVPGSRGGYGLYQLTGPRRTAYEQFAGQRGVDPSDIDTQLDFMMAELNGPEASAYKAIQAAPDTGTAAAAIVNNFLRPAESHRAAREARYLREGGAKPAEISVADIPQPSVGGRNFAPEISGAEVASLDPSIGLTNDLVQRGPMPKGAVVPIPNTPAAVSSISPQDAMSPVAQRPAQRVAQAAVGQDLNAIPVAAGGSAGALTPEQAAQAGPFPDAPTSPQAKVASAVAQASAPSVTPSSPTTAKVANAMAGPSLDQLMQAASDPWVMQQYGPMVETLLKQKLQQEDPANRLALEKAQLEIANLRNPRRDLVNAGKGHLYDPNTGQWLTAPDMGTDAPTVQTFFDDKTGQEYKAQWDTQKREWVPVGGAKTPKEGITVTSPDGTTMTLGGGSGQKLTEGQSKDIGFYTRGSDADNVLATKDSELLDWTQQNTDKIPLGLGNYLTTPEFKQAKQAADSFLTAILRKDTGAAITNQEFQIYGPMFLPVPGDDQATIEQKRRGRQVALLAIKSGLGTADAIAEANRIILGLPANQLPGRPDPGQTPAPKKPTVIDGYTIEEVE